MRNPFEFKYLNLMRSLKLSGILDHRTVKEVVEAAVMDEVGTILESEDVTIVLMEGLIRMDSADQVAQKVTWITNN